MSNTYRTDRGGNRRKEGLHKKQKTHVCRCEYCTGVSKNLFCEKIAEKELKRQIELDEYNFKQSGEFIEDIDDPYYTSNNNGKIPNDT